MLNYTEQQAAGRAKLRTGDGALLPECNAASRAAVHLERERFAGSKDKHLRVIHAAPPGAWFLRQHAHVPSAESGTTSACSMRHSPQFRAFCSTPCIRCRGRESITDCGVPSASSAAADGGG